VRPWWLCQDKARPIPCSPPQLGASLSGEEAVRLKEELMAQLGQHLDHLLGLVTPPSPRDDSEGVRPQATVSLATLPKYQGLATFFP
jgi:hypothetical protein